MVAVPSEIFSVLDKLGSPDWSSQIRLSEKEVPKDRAILALTLGGYVAEGFLAVQAQDEDSIREMIAFPKNNKGNDLMSQSPAEVDPKQLRDLRIKTTAKKQAASQPTEA